MFFQGFNEHLNSVASLFSQVITSCVDILSSFIDPLQVLVGNFDFIFNVFSVGGGFISRLFVGIGNKGIISDFLGHSLFGSGMSFVSFVLIIDVFIFQVLDDLSG